MNSELQQYADIIEQLKPVVGEPEFNHTLNQLTQDLSNDKRFLVKMELKRLAKPCLRSIDLRGQVKGACKLFEFKGRKHYLDDVAIDVFHQQLRVFGHYCFGVYEAVIATENNFRVMREKAERAQIEEQPGAGFDTSQALSQYTVPVVDLLKYAHRDHERMNFAVSVEVFNDQQTSVRGNSVDISMDGLRLKLPLDAYFRTHERLSIYFRGLEDEFAMDKRYGIAYTLLSVQKTADFQYLQLQRDTAFPNPSFDKFLENFIHGNKRRYKVNLGNTIEAIENKSAEQYISPSSPSLPVFIDIKDGEVVPRFAMLNEVNRETVAYWEDETQTLRLGYLLNTARLKWLINQPEAERELYVYSFTHIQNGAVYFYSASARELDKQALLKKVFIGFGARKVSWRVFKLTLTEMTPDQANTRLSIPDSVGSQVKRQNAPHPARLMARLKNLRFICHVTDVTSDSGQQIYAKTKFNRNSLSHLRVFAHPRNRPPVAIRPYRYRFQEQRMETRFLLRSPIVLTVHNQETELKGISEDISISGLRIEISGEFFGEVGDLVTLGLPKLQAITNKYDVMSLFYEVIHYNHERNILHLRSAEGENGKTARQFFDELIKQNKQTLKTYPEEEEIPGIGHALRCINAKNNPNLAFLLTKAGIRYTPLSVITSDRDKRVNELAHHFTTEREANLEFLYRDRSQESPFIQQSLRRMKTENQPVRQELFIAYDPEKKDSRFAILPQFEHRFVSDDTRHRFIDDALSRGYFIAVSILLSTTGKPDMEMLQAEMNYVSVYALHRARELEERLWNTAATGHLVDVTTEVLLRFGYSRKTIEENRRSKSIAIT